MFLELTIKLRKKYFHPSLLKIIETYISNCIVCKERNPLNIAKHGPLQPSQIYNLFDKCHVDLIGPLVETKRKNKFIIVCIDHFSKYIVTKAIPVANSLYLANFLYNNIFLMYGIPNEIVLDNAKMNKAEIVQHFITLLGSKPIYISPYIHQSSGTVERVNRTLEETLSKFIKNHQNTWDLHLPAATFAINTSPSSASKYSPFEILYGRSPTLPIDLALGSYPFLDDANRIRQETQSNILLAQNRMTSSYNSSHPPAPFTIGDNVMISDLSPKKGTSRKLNPKFKGPYTIEKQLTPQLFQLKGDSKLLKMHVTRLRSMGPNPYNSSNDFSTPSLIIDEPPPPFSEMFKNIAPPKIKKTKKSHRPLKLPKPIHSSSSPPPQPILYTTRSGRVSKPTTKFIPY